MEEERIDFPVLVQKTLLAPDLSKKKPWHNSVNWIDQICAAVNLIPVVGGALAGEVKAITESVTNYQANEFLRKFVRFLYHLEEVGDSERIAFLEEIEEKAQDASGNVMVSIIDRLDNINKQRILANLVRAKCDRNITIEEFFRLESVLQRIPYVDLEQLPKYKEEYYDENGDSELLYSTGVLRPAVYHSNGDKYVLSPLGVNLLKWGLSITVELPPIKGTSTGLEWEVIEEEVSGNIPSVEKIKEIALDAIEEKNYKESDQAMFDYDRYRGK